MLMLAREGELIRTENQVIFDVKGLVHPPNRLIAFPRYIPSPEGNRRGEKGLYGKIYSFSERFQFLEQNMPSLIVHDAVFDETLCEVPVDMVVERYDPVEKLRLLHTSKELSELERMVVHLAEELQEASGIPWSSMGISGSVLTGLTTLQSDVDPVVYGEENGRRAYEALEALLKDDAAGFKRYTRGELQALFDFRSKDTIMGFEDFARVERRKAFQGMYEGTDYFIRFVKDWSQVTEQYGDVCYKNAGYAKITATITDDSEALFTPCTYKIENVTVEEGAKLKPINEIVSFRGRFCEQARKGEKVTAQGKVEHVTDKRDGQKYYRIILGNQPADYMVLSQT
jgi:predicted nucleotidyltransferase